MKPLTRRSKRVAIYFVVAAALIAAVPAAGANVRAFSMTTGTEDKAFVSLDQSTIPYLVAPDSSGGAYVFGRVWLHGTNLKFVHILPDGRVDPGFHASIDNGSVFSAVVRGNELALLGTFRSINGQPRRHVAVLDARSGRLESWIPWLSQKPIGQGFSHIVFAGTHLVAGVQGAVVAWRDGASKPVWTRSYVYRGEVPEIASWRGTILATSEGGLYRIDPSDGRAHLADPGFRWSKFQTVGGHLTYSAEGSYMQYDRPRSSGVPCDQDGRAASVAVALTGTSTMAYVAVGPIDIESSNPPPTKIFACNWASGVQPATFRQPSLAGVGAMAVVGSHLLVFTDGR